MANEPFILPEIDVVRRPPANLAAADHELFAHELEKSLPSVSTQALSSVTVLPNGYLTRRVLPIRESFARRPTGLRRLHVVARAFQAALVARDERNVEKALFVTDEFSNGFFHWICDVLPRLEALTEFAPEALATRTLVLPGCGDFPLREGFSQAVQLLESHGAGLEGAPSVR